MPYKDKDKEYAVNRKTKEKLYYPTIGVVIRRDDGTFYDSLLDASTIRDISPAEYLRRAAKEKLIRDDEMK